jgi:hypothetical protein
MKPPSTAWQERVDPGEDARFREHAAKIAAVQQKRSADFGAGRTLHRKQRVGVRATLDVLPDLPAHAAHGLFARPATYDARVRLSNGSFAKQQDKTGDIRGFAFSVRGVTGDSALGGPASVQEFALINHEAFSSPTSGDFVDLVASAQDGQWKLIWHLVTTRGLFRDLGDLMQVKRLQDKPFTGFATETFWSAAPLRCGPYACRVRVLPASGEIRASAAEDWARDIADRLRAGPLVHAIQLQFFVDEETTPIEDASVVWREAEAPYVTVARLTLPQQDLDSAESQAMAAEIEAGRFDPWQALAEHRPLGEVMRARKVVYLASQQGRDAGWR